MSQARAGLGTLVVAGLILGAGGAGYVVLFDDPPPAAHPTEPRQARTAAGDDGAPGDTAPAVVPAATFELVELEGVVEVRRDGAWRPAGRGERLARGDAIRTGGGGRTVLRTSGGDELALRERVDLEVESLSATVTDLTLTRGKLNAAAAPGTERLRIAAGGAEAIGGAGGRFTVYADPTGTVNVASSSGEVKVLARGQAVTVGPGMLTRVPTGQPPVDPVPIPEAVFLSVAWPEREQSVSRVTVRGKVVAGSLVSVNGQPATMSQDGRFEASVSLREGRNQVSVVAETIDGRVERQGVELVVNTDGPPLVADPSRMFDPAPGGPDAAPRR